MQSSLRPIYAVVDLCRRVVDSCLTFHDVGASLQHFSDRSHTYVPATGCGDCRIERCAEQIDWVNVWRFGLSDSKHLRLHRDVDRSESPGVFLHVKREARARRRRNGNTVFLKLVAVTKIGFAIIADYEAEISVFDKISELTIRTQSNSPC